MASESSVSRPAAAAGFVLTVLTVAVGLQCLRMMFPVAYTYREAHGVAATATVALIVFLAPAVAPLLAAQQRPAIRVGAVTGLLVAARLTLQVAHPARIATAAVAAAVALVAIAVAVMPAPDGRTPTLALLGGLALDTALRGAFATWDLAWQDDGAAWTVTVVMLLSLVGAAALAARHRQPAEPTDRTWIVLALGPLLALEVLFLQNVGAVAGAGRMALAGATAVLLAADGLGAAIMLGLTVRPLPRRAVVATTFVAAVVVGAMPAATGTRFVALVLVGQVLVAVLFARAAAGGPGAAHTRRATAAAATGGAVLGLTLFLYQLHYDRPLPVDNRWLPVAAAVIVGVAGLGTRPVAALRPIRRRTLAFAGGGCIIAGAALVAGIALGEPDLTAIRAGDSIRVATFNVHNAVTRDGQVDLEAIARHIEAVDPDVLVVEEADRGWLLAGTTDVAEWLKRRLDMPYAWAPAADEQMGNLVFHRVPLRNAEVVTLPQGAGTMHRSALIAQVGPVAGRDLTLIGVHFQNGSSPAHKDTRIAEADVLLGAWGGRPRTVLLGDFNMDPGERDLRHLLDAGFSSTQPTDRCALKTSNDNCVDWILVTDDLAQGRPRVIPADEFDHNPLASTVRPR